MTQLGPGIAGYCFSFSFPQYHPWEWSARVNRNVEAYKRFYIRFQSDMTMLPTGRHQAPLYWSWGTGDGYYVLDRQSIATHEFGHAIPLGHPGDLRWTDPQTMWGFYDEVNGDRTGVYMRTPSADDAFGLKKLYPSQL